MPPEYERQRDSMISKGIPEKKAKKIAAINYYKKTGKSVNSTDKRRSKRA